MCCVLDRHTNANGYGNIMYDRRVIRGSTYAQRVLPPVIIVSLSLNAHILVSVMLIWQCIYINTVTNGFCRRDYRDKHILKVKMSILSDYL